MRPAAQVGGLHSRLQAWLRCSAAAAGSRVRRGRLASPSPPVATVWRAKRTLHRSVGFSRLGPRHRAPGCCCTSATGWYRHHCSHGSGDRRVSARKGTRAVGRRRQLSAHPEISRMERFKLVYLCLRRLYISSCATAGRAQGSASCVRRDLPDGPSRQLTSLSARASAASARCFSSWSAWVRRWASFWACAARQRVKSRVCSAEARAQSPSENPEARGRPQQAGWFATHVGEPRPQVRLPILQRRHRALRIRRGLRQAAQPVLHAPLHPSALPPPQSLQS